MPGCPELAFCTASADSMRMVLMARFSSVRASVVGKRLSVQILYGPVMRPAAHASDARRGNGAPGRMRGYETETAGSCVTGNRTELAMKHNLAACSWRCRALSGSEPA